MVTRRFFLSGATGAFSAALMAGGALGAPMTETPRPRLRPVSPRSQGAEGLEAVLSRSRLSGSLSCVVADAATGEVLEGHNQDTALPPASVAKAITALYALDVLGAGHRFRTRVIALGPVVNGVLDGDLVLAGGGDPTLDSDGLAQLAASVKEAGLREVRGRLLVWEGALPYVASIDPGQPDHVGYSPAVSGLALNFNRVHFEWKPAGQGWTVTMDARTARYRPDVTMAKMEVVSRQGPVYTYMHARDHDSWTVARGALGKGGARWLPVRRPGLYAGDVFRTMLRAQGIVLPYPEVTDLPPQGQTIAQHHSAPLPVLLKDMLKYSNNLMAEMIGLAATRRNGAWPGNLAQSGAAMSEWVKLRYGMRASRFVDHSGLGPKSRVSAQDFTRAMVAAHREAVLEPLLKPFFLRDSAGKLTKSHPVTVMAKTGTLNFVSGLGGFVTGAGGREMVFAIFSADEAKRASIPRSQRERPKGAKGWNGQAKGLQRSLLERWGEVYAGRD